MKVNKKYQQDELINGYCVICGGKSGQIIPTNNQCTSCASQNEKS